MNKSVRVVITSIILIAVFISAALTSEACKTKTKTLEEKADDAFEQHSGDEFFEDDLTPDNETYETDDNTTDFSNNSTEPEDYTEVKDKSSYTEPDETVTTYEETPIRRATTEGKYLIVAGNFLVQSNADEMVNKLVNLGYNSAEVAVFDYSQYYTVIASRSDDYALAKNLSVEIKGKGVDCYVHTRK